MKILILKYIEDHANVRFLCIQKGCHCLHRNLRGLFLWKMKFSGGNTTKGNAPTTVLHGQFHTGTVTGGQRLTILLPEGPIDNRPHGVQNVFAGQVEGWRDLRLSRGLLMSLSPHDIITKEPQLDSAPRVNDVVDTGVKGPKTA